MTQIKCPGTIIRAGIFSGKVIYLESESDLSKVDKNSLVFLNGCSKLVATQALLRCHAVVNLRNSLTTHLSLTIPQNVPFAVSPQLKEQQLQEGNWVEIDILPLAKTSENKMVRFVPILSVSDIPSIGGKAARLFKLKEMKLNVPSFEVLSVEQIGQFIALTPIQKILSQFSPSSEITPELLKMLQDAIQNTPTPNWNLKSVQAGKKFAVRSSGVYEDDIDNAMAGAFSSVLNIFADKITQAIAEIASSIFNANLWFGKKVADLRTPQPLAIIIQEMVANPLFAGAFFTHASNFDTLPVLEARYCGYADKQMDGCQEPDIVARSNAQGTSVSLERYPQDLDKSIAQSLGASIIQEALAIHHQTGWGDMEFVLDTQHKIHWVQARPLTHTIARVVEVVDRKNFSTTGLAYYKNIAFSVCQANQIPSVKINLFQFENGRFGYDEGIRERDRSFHQTISRNPEHLKKVTEYGWEIEEHIAKILKYDSPEPANLLQYLIIHAAVQLPFCIPSAVVKDRYNSFSVDTENNDLWEKSQDLWLDTIVEHWLSLAKFPEREKITPVELVNILRSPIDYHSQLEQYRAIEKLVLLHNEPIVEDCWNVAVFSLRDIPYLPQEPMRPISDPGNIEDENLKEAVDSVRQARQLGKVPGMAEFCKIHNERCQKFSQVLQHLNNTLPTKEKDELEIIVPWLRLKGETNETHSFYRGSTFLKLAKIYAKKGLNPRKVFPEKWEGK